MKRTALLIGNDKYDVKNKQLHGAVNDAVELGKSLKNLGFDIDVKTDLSCNEMGKALAGFKRTLSEYNVGLFFFAGHGFQIEGINYLGCTDVSFTDSSSAKYTAFELQMAIDALEESNLETKILIIDACREYFAGYSRGIMGGFAPVFAPKGTIIAFSTSPGQTASEHDGHGVYTSALLRHIETEKIAIEEMFKRVRNTVYLETKGKQITWEHTSLMGNFKFNEGYSIISKNPYSKFALADREYEVERDGLCKELIDMARMHDWNYQNKIPGLIQKRAKELITSTPDDLFVLGRNIYQSSQEPFSVAQWVENLHDSLNKIEVNAANHILSGMAYEIYFDSDGNLRRKLKTLIHYKKIIQEILSDKRKGCLSFIVNQLNEYKQRVIYIPGQDILRLDTFLEANEEKRMFFVRKILLDGLNVLYDENGIDYYNPEESYKVAYGDKKDLEESIRNHVASTNRGCMINIYSDKEEPFEVCIPVEYCLLRYGNTIK